MEQGTSIGPPPFPREHGAWAVLLVPFFIGAVVGGTMNVRLLLLFGGTLAVFMACVPAEVVLRHLLDVPQGAGRLRQATAWMVIFLLMASVPAIAVATEHPPIILLGLGGAALFAFSVRMARGRGKGVASDLMAVAGLTLTAPASYVVSGGSSGSTALELWGFNGLFFGSSVFYVHMKMLAAGQKQERLSNTEKWILGKSNLLYHAVVVTLVTALTILEYSPALVIVAFTPIIVHAVVGTLRLGAKVRFRRLGVILLAHSLVFAIVFSLAQR